VGVLDVEMDALGDKARALNKPINEDFQEVQNLLTADYHNGMNYRTNGEFKAGFHLVQDSMQKLFDKQVAVLAPEFHAMFQKQIVQPMDELEVEIYGWQFSFAVKKQMMLDLNLKMSTVLSALNAEAIFTRPELEPIHDELCYEYCTSYRYYTTSGLRCTCGNRYSSLPQTGACVDDIKDGARGLSLLKPGDAKIGEKKPVHPFLCYMDNVETCTDVVCEDACLYGVGSPFFEQQRVEEHED
jgi:hypothetical protein